MTKKKILRTRPIHFGLLGIVLFVMMFSSKWLTRASEPETAVLSETNATSIFLPVVLHNFDFTLGIPLFGTQMYGSTGSNSVYHPYLLDSGASWLRVPVSWRSVEPVNSSPDAMNWNSVDNSLAAAGTDMGGINIIATLVSSPDWATETVGNSQGPIDVEDLDDFAEFVGAMVERYDGDGYNDADGSPVVHYWEFDNEPDSGDRSWSPHWGDYGAEYAQMLSFAYPAAKAASSNAQVVLGGLAYDWFYEQGGNFNPEFLDDVLQAGGGDYFDVMNFHYYPAFKNNWLPPGGQGPGLLEKTEAIRDKLTLYGIESKPIMITEAGYWSDNGPPNLPQNPEIQARYVVELFTQSLAGDVQVMIWWMLYDPGSAYMDAGLVTNDAVPVPKLSFVAYQAIVEELSTSHFERVLTLAETGNPDMEVYQFNDNVHNQTIYVAWLDPVDTTEVKPLRLTASQATVRNIYGDVTSVVNSSGDGTVTVQVGGQPIYVEVSK